MFAGACSVLLENGEIRKLMKLGSNLARYVHRCTYVSFALMIKLGTELKIKKKQENNPKDQRDRISVFQI